MDDPRSHYTDAQKLRIAKDARRSAASEFGVIVSAGGAAFAVAYFVFGFPGLVTLKFLTGLPETLIWVLMSFGSAFLIAAYHFPRATRTIARAVRLDAAFLHAQEAEQRRDVEARIRAMKGKRP
ncbi:MAG: hypothetical protein AAFR53_03110 [Pseudomonadota bacterium]